MEIHLAPYFSTGVGINYGRKIWNVGLLVTNGRGKDIFKYKKENENEDYSISFVTNEEYMDEDLAMTLTFDLDPMDGLHIDLNYINENKRIDFLRVARNLFSIVNEHKKPLYNEMSAIGKTRYTTNVIDTSVSYKINETFNVALNYISNMIKPERGSNKINSTSLATYLNARYSLFSFNFRYEQFDFDVSGHGGDEQTWIFYNGHGGPGTGLRNLKNSMVRSMTFTKVNF